VTVTRTSALPRRNGIVAAWRALEDWRRRFTRPGSLVWTRNVNHRGGSALALVLVRTRLSANAVTLSALAVAIAGAAFLATRGVAFGPGGAVLLAAVWQLGFCLDCADGQLARARSEATPFGAWLDQLCDFVAHAAIFCALAIYLVRTLELGAVAAVFLLGGTFGANLLQLFASSQRNSMLAPASPLAAAGVRLGALAAGRHLSDWGAFLLLTALLLPYPRAAAGAVAAAALIALLTVVGQVALNWRQARALAEAGRLQ
jgi:phosphatidylglycerophosphate synthase